MNTQKQPDNIYIAWDEKGCLKGAHVSWIYVTRDDDGSIVSAAVKGPFPLYLTPGAEGFPLGDLLSQAQADALTAKATADAERDAAMADRDAALSRVADLEAQLAALRPAAE